MPAPKLRPSVAARNCRSWTARGTFTTPWLNGSTTPWQVRGTDRWTGKAEDAESLLSHCLSASPVRNQNCVLCQIFVNFFNLIWLVDGCPPMFMAVEAFCRCFWTQFCAPGRFWFPPQHRGSSELRPAAGRHWVGTLDAAVDDRTAALFT